MRAADLCPLELAAELRRQLVELVGHIDATGRPAPDHINAPDHRLPGQVWHPDAGWTIRTVHDEFPDTVYLTTPHNLDPSEIIAYQVSTMRRIAMAMLAACDATEQRQAGVLVFRRNELEHGECGGACRD